MNADTLIKQPDLDRLGRFSKVPRSQAAAVAIELAREVYRASQEEKADDETVADRLTQAVDLLEQIQEILNPLTVPLDRWSDTANRRLVEEQNETLRRSLSDYERKAPSESRIWHFPNAQWGLNATKDNRDSWPVNREELSRLCAEYVDTPWMNSKSLDRILVHAFVYAETHGFGLSIRPAMLGMSSLDAILHPLKPGQYEKRTLRRSITTAAWELAWLLLFLAVGVAAYIDSNRWWLGVSVGLGLIFVYAIWAILTTRESQRARSKINNLLTEMQTVSKQIATLPISLLFLRDRLVTLANNGVVWDGAVFAILDKAIRRGQISW